MTPRTFSLQLLTAMPLKLRAANKDRVAKLSPARRFATCHQRRPSMARTVTLIGLSRSPYYYTACDMSKGGWMRVAGNYAFLDALDRPVYVGETSDFAGR